MKTLLAVILFLSCNEPNEQDEVMVEDFADGLYSSILCEEEFETCGIQGFTEWGVPVLLISEKVSDYFAPYGLLMWELPPETMERVWDSIAEYDLGVAWVGVLPLEKVSVKDLTERMDLRKERKVWIKRVTAEFPDQPERWLRMPKPKKEESSVFFWNLDF